MTPNTFAMAMLVEFAVREAGENASLEEMKAICYAMRNRVRAGWHEGDWVMCMENASEHSADSPGCAPRIPINPQARPFQMLLQSIEDIWHGSRPQPQGGWGAEKVDPDAQGNSLEAAIGTSLYWVHIRRPIRPWFVENIIRDQKNHPERTSLGMWRFHK
jgi:hypothetical protein